jgi:hypothetical protein
MARDAKRGQEAQDLMLGRQLEVGPEHKLWLIVVAGVVAPEDAEMGDCHFLGQIRLSANEQFRSAA